MSFRELFFNIFLFFILVPATLYGSVFDALQPGKSTTFDVHARFGEAVRSKATGDMKIEHFSDKEGLFKEVSAWFNAQDVLQWVRVKLLHKVNADDAPMLFGLTVEPAKTKGNAFDEKQITKGETRHFRSEGVHFYVQDGIVLEIWLTQAEVEASQILAQLKQGEQTKQQQREQIKDLNKRKSYQDDGLTTYFGVVFARHEGEGIKLLGVLDNTPAQNTGLQKGDIILEVENISFRDKGLHAERFSGMVQELPADKPIRFHIERNGKRFDAWIKPLRINKEQLAVYQKEVQGKFSSDYSKGKQLLAQDDYAGAIEYFQKSLKSKSRPMESYQGLGICFYHLGNYKEARKSIEKALKLDKKQPLSWFYGAANMDALNKRNGAIHGYKEYLKLNHNNAEMNAFARDRLDALKKKRISDWSNQLLKVIDAIKKEIKK